MCAVKTEYMIQKKTHAGWQEIGTRYPGKDEALRNMAVLHHTTDNEYRLAWVVTSERSGVEVY